MPVNRELVALITKYFNHIATIIPTEERLSLEQRALIFTIEANLALIQSSVDYHPEAERTLVLQLIKELTPFNLKQLPHLLHQLIIMTDLMIQREPKRQAVLLNEIQVLLTTLTYNADANISDGADQKPKNAFSALKEPLTSPTAHFFRNQLFKIIPELAAQPKFQNPEHTKRMIMRFIDGFLDEPYEPGQSFDQEIQWLRPHYEDKALFARNLLLVYQECYVEQLRQGNAIVFFEFKSLATLLYIINEGLPAGQLTQIMQDINFNLLHPEQYNAKFADTEKYSQVNTYYKHIENILSIIHGHEIPKDRANMGAFLTMLPNDKEGLSLIRLLSQNTLVSPYQPMNKEFLKKLLPIHQLAIAHYDESIIERLESFLAHFVKINDAAPTEQQADFVLFFNKQMDKLLQLMDVMGVAVLEHLDKKIGNTVMPLGRELNSFPAIDRLLNKALKQFFEQQLPVTAQQIALFKTCLNALDVLIRLNAHEDNDLITFYMTIATSAGDISGLVKELSSRVLHLLLNDSQLDLTEAAIQEIFEKIPEEKFIALANATKHMEHDRYVDVFLNFLKLDLTGGNVDQFLHNLEQDNSIGRSLAVHNRAIQEKLVAHGINPESALHYKPTYSFLVKTEESDTSIHNHYLNLWSYFDAFLNEFTRISEDGTIQETIGTESKNSSLLVTIATQLREINKLFMGSIYQPNKNAAIFDVLSHSTATPLFNKLIRTADALKTSCQALGDSFFEFSDHIKIQCELIQEERAKLTTDDSVKYKINKKPYESFRVEQWDKTRAETFFLGDDVSCCLATNGTDFQAMVQRRMDDALIFHVAVDQNTQKPIAMIWLFLLETASQEIVLMANFFEVHSKFGQNLALRKELLNGLLTFVQMYLQDNPGIKGFYMNQLQYGWNRTDLTPYPIKPLDILDKVGGAYRVPHGATPTKHVRSPSIEESQRMTKKLYFLVSLDRTDFHQFDPMILMNELRPTSMALDTFIQNAIARLMKSTADPRMISNLLIKRHRLELEPFFKTPLAEDPAFQEAVSAAYQQVVDSASLDFQTANSMRFFSTSSSPRPSSSTLLSSSNLPALASSVNTEEDEPLKQTATSASLFDPF